MATWEQVDNARSGDSFDFALLYVDIAGHSVMSKETKSRLMQKIKTGFYGYVTEKAEKRKGRELEWGGDGGAFHFWPEDGDNDRFDLAVRTAISILLELRAFNASPDLLTPEPINARIVVHRGIVNVDPATKHFHGNELNMLYKVLAKAVEPGNIVISEQVYAELHPVLKQEFAPAHETQGYKLYQYRYPYAPQIMGTSPSVERVETKVKPSPIQPKVKKEDVESIVGAAKSYRAGGNYTQARSLLETARTLIHLGDISADSPLFRDVYLTHGAVLQELGDYDALINAMDEALGQCMDPEFLYFKARAYLHTARYDEAEDLLDIVLEKDPNNPRFLRTQALLNWERGNTAKAIEVIRKSLEKGHSLTGENSLVYYLAERGRAPDLEEAKTKGQKLISEHPENPAVIDTWAFVLYQSGNHKESRAFANRACELAPGIGAGYYTLGLILRGLGERVLSDVCLWRVLQLEKYPTRFRREAENLVGVLAG